VSDETSPAHSTAVKIDSPHYFSPLSASTKEFKEKQKAVSLLAGRAVIESAA